MTRHLNRSVVSGGVVYPAGTPGTDELEAAITNQSVWDDDDGYVEPVADPVEPVDPPSDPVPPVEPVADPVDYSGKSKAQLEDEISARNAKRAGQQLQPLKPKGKNKQDLVDVLTGDDSSS